MQRLTIVNLSWVITIPTLGTEFFCPLFEGLEITNFPPISYEVLPHGTPQKKVSRAKNKSCLSHSGAPTRTGEEPYTITLHVL